MRNRALSFVLCIALVMCFMPTVAWADGHSHEIGGRSTVFEGTTTLPTTCGSFYLTGDVTLESTWTVPTGTTNLCLNGHSILASNTFADASVIKVPSGAVLNIYDFESDPGSTPAGIRGGISDCSIIKVEVGTLNLYGGTLSGGNNTNGGGVYVDSSGKFNMYGGTISNNTANGDGGGVYVNGSTFTMTGGTIASNSAIGNGGGVYVNNMGSFTLSGGAISNNTANGDGGGVYNNRAFTMIDGTISENTAKNGGGVYNNFAFAMHSGKVVSNSAIENGGGVLCIGNTTIGGKLIVRGNSTSATSEDDIRLSGTAIQLRTGSLALSDGADIVVTINESGDKWKPGDNINDYFISLTDGGSTVAGIAEGSVLGYIKMNNSGSKNTGKLYSVTAGGILSGSWTVIFDYIGVSSQDVNTGNCATKPSPDPTRARYEFGGWYIDSECTTPWAFEFDTVNDDITLYPKWTLKSSRHSSHNKNTTTDSGIVLPVTTDASILFEDVPEDAYYRDAVTWAVGKNITKGTDETHFSPLLGTTRAQMVTFLWRAAGCPEPAASTTAFADIKSGDYFNKAVLWAAENGITTGVDAVTFAPNETVTRAQAVSLIYRTNKLDTLNIKVNPFTDVATGAYYTDAVLWAANDGITSGKTATTFAPEESCNRGQVVTFMYKYYNK